MKYADPNSCPKCRGPIGGVQHCPTCGFDLASSSAQELWGLFVQADRVIELAPDRAVSVSHSGLTSQTDTGPVAPPVFAPNDFGADTRPALKLTPGSVLLGLGALSLVVAATIFVSLTWGSIGIAGRAAILLTITVAFGAGLWFALKRTLAATSEALAFVVLAMLSVNISAAVYEGLFGLDQIHWGYPLLLWSGLILATSLVTQPFSVREIGRNIYTVETGLGLAALGGALGLSSFLWTYAPAYTHWSLFLGIPVLAGFAWLARWSQQRFGFWIVAGLAALWVFATTAWAWLSILDNYFTVSFTWFGPALSLAAIGALLGFVLPVIRPFAYSYAVSNVALVSGMLVVSVLDRHAPVGTIDLVLAFFTVFLAIHVLSEGAITATQRVLTWLNPALALITAFVWFFALGAFLRQSDHAAYYEQISSDAQSRHWLGYVVVAATVILTGVLVRFTRHPFVHADARLETGCRTLAAGTLSLGLAAASSYLTAPDLVVTFLLLAGVLLVVWLSEAAPVWSLVGLPLAIFSLGVFDQPSWSFLIALGSLAAVSGMSGWWISVRSSQDPAIGPVAGTMSFAALSSSAAIYGLWHVPGVLGTVFANSHVFLPLITSLVLVACLGLKPWVNIRIGAELGASLFGAVGLVLAADNESEFALASLALAAACFLVALADASRRWQFVLGLVLATAAWIAQLLAWEVETVEAYTAPVATVLLVIGVLALRVYPELGSNIALFAGLAVAFLPSLFAVLEEPASVRALVWGALAAASLGIGLALHWRAPVLWGAGALVVVMLANVGPFFLDLDRWIIFGVLGATLLGIGIRWEQNVVDGKALFMKLAHLR